MAKQFTALAVAAFLTATAVAQPRPEPKDGKLVIPITLSAQAAPKPVSDYYLTPQYKEQQPGDQLSGFMKCFMEQQYFFNKENEEKRQKFLDMPLADLPDDVRQQTSTYGGLMTNLDLAARFTRTEWNEYFLIRSEGINWLLPEVQYMRRLAFVAKLRLRGEVKAGEFDKAIQSLKTLTGLSNMFKSHPTIIGSLVGIAVQSMAWDGAEEMIAQPGCPNLFWSIVDLPHPPFPIRRGLEGERMFLDAQFEPLLKSESPLADDQVAKLLSCMDGMIETEMKKNTPKTSDRIAKFAADNGRLAAACERLAMGGRMSPALVGKLSPTRAILADDYLHYVVQRDELMKYANLSYPQAMAGLAGVEKEIQATKADWMLAPLVIATVSRVKMAETRNAQRVAMLAVLEGLRLHAAGSGGELPATLDAVKLPLPVDPATLKPFAYSVKDGVATLTGAKVGANPQRVYEIRLRK
jgi:hypothetical protein